MKKTYDVAHGEEYWIFAELKREMGKEAFIKQMVDGWVYGEEGKSLEGACFEITSILTAIVELERSTD